MSPRFEEFRNVRPPQSVHSARGVPPALTPDSRWHVRDKRWSVAQIVVNVPEMELLAGQWPTIPQAGATAMRRSEAHLLIGD